MSASTKSDEKVPGPLPAAGPTESFCPPMPVEKAQAQKVWSSSESADFGNENLAPRVDQDFSNDSITPPSNDPGTPIVDWTISGTCRWMIDADGRLVIAPSSGSLGELEDWGYQGAPWGIYAESIRSVSFSGVVSAPTTCGMLRGCSSLTSLDLSGLDTSRTTDMGSMFRGCRLITSLDLSGLDTSSVMNMDCMFGECRLLISLDLSGLDTSSVTNMREMFRGCSWLASLDLSGLDTSRVENMDWMFDGCSSLTSLDLSGLDTSRVGSMSSMFSNCSSLASLDLSGLDTSRATDMSSMFSNCSSLASLDLSGLDTSRVKTMSCMFDGCSWLASLDLSGLDTSSVGNMDCMFRGCSLLTSLDLSGLDTSHVGSMSSMFDGCSRLASLDLSSLDTSGVKIMDWMFRGCSNLQAVTFGAKFSFGGTWRNCLPTPSGDGLTGRWISSANGIAYMPGGIPSNFAFTYVAQVKDEAPKTAIAESTFAVGTATKALTECPGCGNDVSAFASSCPNCGFPVVLYAGMKGRAKTQSDDPLELVAFNPHTPIVILEMLSENSNWCVRAALTRNPSTSENLLLQLADDEDDDVRIALASSPYATIGVMEKLSDDADGDVIDALRQNPSTPEYIQRELERQLGNDGNRSDNDFDYDGDNDDYEYSSLDISADDFGNQYYRYGDTYLPYHDGEIEYDGKYYDVMDGGDYGVTMYFDEDNGWLTELP